MESRCNLLFSVIFMNFLLGCSSNRPITITENKNEITPTSSPNVDMTNYWKEYREAEDGWGIAVPIDWIIDENRDAMGELRYLQIHNYDKSFYENYSERGQFKPAFLPLIIGIEISKHGGALGAQSMKEAVERIINIDNINAWFIYANEKEINGNSALEYATYCVYFPDQENIRSLAIKLNEDEILFFIVNENPVWERQETIAIINSIVVDKERRVILPSFIPVKLLSHK